MRHERRYEDGVTGSDVVAPISDRDARPSRENILLVLDLVGVKRHASAIAHDKPTHGESWSAVERSDQNLHGAVVSRCHLSERDRVGTLHQTGARLRRIFIRIAHPYLL